MRMFADLRRSSRLRNGISNYSFRCGSASRLSLPLLKISVRKIFVFLGVLFCLNATFLTALGGQERQKEAPASEKSSSEGPSSEETPANEDGDEYKDLQSFGREKERERMVKTQIAGRDVTDKQVLEAMRSVPRHLFVGEENRNAAYRDSPLPIGYGQTISQPYIVAYMTEKLDIDSGDKVLEIGTGSGYQAAVLSEITKNVYTIEIIEELAAQARERFKELGYDSINVKAGDGYYGWKEHAPFDAIIVTAAAGHVPPPLVRQLKAGGRIVIPVGGVYQVQTLTLVKKESEDSIKTEQLMPVRFVPMTGQVQKE